MQDRLQRHYSDGDWSYQNELPRIPSRLSPTSDFPVAPRKTLDRNPPSAVVDHVFVEHRLPQNHAPESLSPDDLDSVPPLSKDPPVLAPGHVAGMEPGLVDPRDRHGHGVERSREAFARINWRQDVMLDDP